MKKQWISTALAAALCMTPVITPVFAADPATSSTASSTVSTSSAASSSTNTSTSSSTASSSTSSAASSSTASSTQPTLTKIDTATVEGLETSYTYTGKAIEPELTLKDGTKELKEGTDYSVAYKDNTNVGTAVITITGKGDYEGTLQKEFTITPAVLVEEEVEGIYPYYGETGKAIEPASTIMVGENTLKAGTDYTVEYKDNTKQGTATVTITGKGNYEGTVTKTFEIVASQEMYRLYNPNDGEHMYTTNKVEKDYLASIGWDYEGIGWYAPAKSDTVVYRVYNPNTGEHHWTSDENERNFLISAGWNNEGIGWYSENPEGTPVYREYNPNKYAFNHNYTVSKHENDYLVSIGWKYEGIAWYGVDQPEPEQSQK